MDESQMVFRHVMLNQGFVTLRTASRPDRLRGSLCQQLFFLLFSFLMPCIRSCPVLSPVLSSLLSVLSPVLNQIDNVAQFHGGSMFMLHVLVEFHGFYRILAHTRHL